MHLSKSFEVLGNKLTGRWLDLLSFDFFCTGVISAVFKADKNIQKEMTDFGYKVGYIIGNGGYKV